MNEDLSLKSFHLLSKDLVLKPPNRFPPLADFININIFFFPSHLLWKSFSESPSLVAL